jgi:hypothetical protein
VDYIVPRYFGALGRVVVLAVGIRSLAGSATRQSRIASSFPLLKVNFAVVLDAKDRPYRTTPAACSKGVSDAGRASFFVCADTSFTLDLGRWAASLGGWIYGFGHGEALSKKLLVMEFGVVILVALDSIPKKQPWYDETL